MKENFNPAKRLLYILQKAYDIGKENEGQIESKKVWQQTLGVEDEKLFIAAFSDLVKLVAEVKTIIEEFDEKKRELYIQGFDEIERSMSLHSLSLEWNRGGIPSYQRKPLSTLEFLSSFLESKYNESEISQEELTQWKKDLEAIETEILDSSIDARAKELFSKQLNTLIQSINFYKINGMEGVEEAMHANLGILIQMLNVKESQKTGEKFLGIFRRMGAGLAVAASVSQITGLNVMNLLGKG